MFEHTSLHEAYTGSLIAGKGKNLNNIRQILERNKFIHEDWARVRFGAGTPWRRCWCVVSPPSEKDFQKQQKIQKKRSVYDRPIPIRGDIKFYETSKTKKAKPIATITEVYSAFAIYPQSMPLIEQSTLVKVEGTITIHSSPETSTEGFLFVMPEVHPGVSGFEMMLRWLFPAFDTFALYGRPARLIADTLDPKGIMFAMPQNRRYGYLDILDVAGLIHTEGSAAWSEREWRKKLKELTSNRMNSTSRIGSRAGSRHTARHSLSSRTGTLRYGDDSSIRSSPSIKDRNRVVSNSEYTQSSDAVFAAPKRIGTAPVGMAPSPPPHRGSGHSRSNSEVGPSTPPRHRRSISEAHGYTPSRLSYENVREDGAPPPPLHGTPLRAQRQAPFPNLVDVAQERSSSESERMHRDGEQEAQELRREIRPSSPPEPVAAPPAFVHQPGAKPQTRPTAAPELLRARSRMSVATLTQLADANKPRVDAAAGAAAAWNNQAGGGQSQQRGVNEEANSTRGMRADDLPGSKGMVLDNTPTSSPQATTPISRVPVPSSYSQERQRQLPNSNQVPSSGFPAQSITPPPSSIPRRPGGPSQVDSSKSITRKPVAIPPPDAPPSTMSDSDDRLDSLGSLRQHAIDVDALDRIAAMGNSESRQEDIQSRAQHDDDDSHYESDASPDYASTRQSIETKRSEASVQRPRTGVLRTVGTPAPEVKEAVIGDARYTESKPFEPTTEIPTVDFGPTHHLDPAQKSRPGTSGTMTGLEGGEPREEAENKRLSRASQPAVMTTDQLRRRSKSPGRALQTADGRGSPLENENRRSVAWQPGSRMGRSPSPGAGPALSAEEWIQQRASSGRVTPIYAHQRNDSNSSAQPYTHQHNRSTTSITPPFTRTGSGDWSQQQQSPKNSPSRPMSRNTSYTLGEGPSRPHSRNASMTLDNVPLRPHSRNASAALSEMPPRPRSRGASTTLGDPLQRPSSRGASTAFNEIAARPSSRGVMTALNDVPSRPHSRNASQTLNSPGLLADQDYTHHMSAREQEHVARMTGSPLLNMNAKSKPQVSPSGLVSAIDAREREKKAIREGVSGTMVQHAIAQRQQQQQQQQLQQQQQIQIQATQSMAYAQQQQQQQQQFVPGAWPATPGMHPAASAYWGAPIGSPQSPQGQMYYDQQQQQFFPPQSQQPQQPRQQGGYGQQGCYGAYHGQGQGQGPPR